MSPTNAIRLYGERGPGTLDQLIEITAPLIKQIKSKKLVTGSMLDFVDELYAELVKRGEIEPIKNISETDKKRYWLAAKKTGVTDRNKLIQISRSIYLCEII